MTIKDKSKIFNGLQYNSSSSEVFDKKSEAVAVANLRKNRSHSPQLARVSKEIVYRVYFRPKKSAQLRKR